MQAERERKLGICLAASESDLVGPGGATRPRRRSLRPGGTGPVTPSNLSHAEKCRSNKD
jgi:hypothetical protein